MDPRIALIHEAALRCFTPHATSRFVDEPEIAYLITPGLVDGTFNEVSRFTHEGDGVEEAIDGVIAMYRSRGLPFKWVVGPGSAPADLVDRLEARGLSRWRARGMVADPTRLSVTHPADVRVARVAPEDLDDYVSTAAAAWNAPREAVVAHSNGDDPKQVRFVAWVHGVAAGTAALGDLGDHAYLTGAAVVDVHRGRGVYRALVAARLAHCRERDIPLAVTQARESTSAPILGRLGFETVYRFDMFAG